MNDNEIEMFEEFQSDSNQKRYIKGWFKRINDISRKFGCDTIFRSRHFNK